MTSDQFEYDAIGVIRTPFESPEGMPIQSAGTDATGTVELAESYAAGLQDLAEFSHCILLYHFHASDDDVSLTVEPFLDEAERGLFATRAPQRPNPIGLSVVEIDTVTDREITVNGVDVVDGTPLLDIKPFVPQFDAPDDVDAGWLETSQSAVTEKRADDRFC
ncbi:tRNA (N6-threonylcarbamoyladenosine(37)-N6)-methyltransferase TrmO [Natronorubrum thiooxidans]|uniref:tRNA-Thr(GGU) m(6)t(6)A37 methyltransferase TsaA n=1 Tax=Natronorubrum thiooxidans TaxID=308853 RepID=A0A1N7FJD0_9EURY|nr:tRNA (N6-threonylcarbamoyladenosine(37)-N6)-methyltransferase TrmO [Natronorubrum thiooxidans]SIS00397.1 tRNA-Thr(GGU) m(6)t(6)A37 methyltransferase TsaA [Natronorubrum thiooxidans]